MRFFKGQINFWLAIAGQFPIDCFGASTDEAYSTLRFGACPFEDLPVNIGSWGRTIHKGCAIVQLCEQRLAITGCKFDPLLCCSVSFFLHMCNLQRFVFVCGVTCQEKY